MAKLKDGFYKLIGLALGDDSHVLLAGGGNKLASSFYFPSKNITPLTGYTKGTNAALKVTDSLNVALGKLECKADLGVDAYDLVFAANNGDTIDNLTEILKVLNGIKDTDTIQAIIGKYVPLKGTTDTNPITGSLVIHDNDGLRIKSNNKDLKIWEIHGGNIGTYGFHELYKGTSAGNDNSLDLYAHNTSGDHILTRRVYLNGVIDFYQLVNFSATPKVNGTKVSLEGHNHDSRYYTELESDNRFVNIAGDTMTGPLIIKGAAASNPLMVRGITGSDGESGAGPLYLQLTQLGNIYFGGETHYISADGSLYTGNAKTSTTASKLNTVSKTAWGQTYWTSGGVPTTISGNMSNVGEINACLKVTGTGNARLQIQGVSSTNVDYVHLYINGGSNNSRPLVLQKGYGKVGIGTEIPSEKLEVNGNIKAQAFIGNASTASKLHTPRKINGVSFDGTSDITITANPNSHTHPYTQLTGSGTTADLVIVSTGETNKWKLKTLGSRAFDSTAYLPLTGGIISNSGFGPLIISRNSEGGAAAIKFLRYINNNVTSFGAIGMNVLNGELIRFNSNYTSNYKICDSSNSSVSGLTIKINGSSTTWKDTWRPIISTYNTKITDGDDISLSLTGANNLYSELHNGYASLSGLANTLKVFDNRNLENPKKPSQYSASVYAEFNCHEIPATFNGWKSTIGICGWADSKYLRWEICSDSGDTSSGLHEVLCYRAGSKDTWGIWKTIAFTDSNITGNASSADKLNTSAGGVMLPVYFSDGKPVALKTFKNNTQKSDLGWSSASNDTMGITSNTLAYWDGAYSSDHKSNLTYCNRGAFGTIVTKNSGDYLAIHGKADDSDKLDGFDSTDFVRSTGTVALSISGLKTFLNTVLVNALTITNTGAISHLKFSRKKTASDNYGINYIAAPTDGAIALMCNNNTAAANTTAIIDASSIHPYTDNTRTLGTSTHKWNAVYANTFYGKFVTTGGNNTQVILGDGSLKSLSELNSSHNHDDRYVNVSGDTMTGLLTMNSNWILGVNGDGMIRMYTSGNSTKTDIGSYRDETIVNIRSSKLTVKDVEVSLNTHTHKIVGNINFYTISGKSSYSDEIGFAKWAWDESNRNTKLGYFSILKPSENLLGLLAHGTIITVGLGDTHMLLGVDYSRTNVIIGAGNSNKINWYKKISLEGHTHDDRYYTKSESDDNYVNVSGDTMTGDLILSGTNTSFIKDFDIVDSNGGFARDIISIKHNNKSAANSRIGYLGSGANYTCFYIGKGEYNDANLFRIYSDLVTFNNKRLAYVDEILNPTNYYWANIKISSTSNSKTTPTFASARLSGDLLMGGSIYWDNVTYRQRITVTDDAVANTSVFNFQLSSDSGKNFTTLATIKDDGLIQAGGFVKSGGEGKKVLLDNGTSKAISDFSMSHTHPYLPLAGGTMTGAAKIKWTTAGNNYIYGNSRDAASSYGEDLNNLVLDSWYGVSITTNCPKLTYTGKNAISFNSRNGNTYIGGELKVNNTGTFIGTVHSSAGFKKGDLTNDRILLAGGGDKAISDFSLAHSHPYLRYTKITSKVDFDNITTDGAYNTGTDSNTTSNTSNGAFTTSHTTLSFNMYKSGTDDRTVQLALDGYGDAKIRGFRTSKTWYNILSSKNSSVSKSEETLTVKINGTTQSLTNTWRKITDVYKDVENPSNTTSLSQKGAQTLYNELYNGNADKADYADHLVMNPGDTDSYRNLWFNTHSFASTTSGKVKVASNINLQYNPAQGILRIGTGNAAGTLTNSAYSGSSTSIVGISSSTPNSCYLDEHVRFFKHISHNSSNLAGTNGFPTGNNANGILWLGTHEGKYGEQLGFSSNGNIYHRTISAGTFPESWKTLLDSSNYQDYLLKGNVITKLIDLKITLDWMDTGININDLTSGTYVVQIHVTTTTDKMEECYFSGIMSWYSGVTTDDTPETDEIVLHRAGKSYDNTIYLRTYVAKGNFKLEIAANKDLSTSYTYTFKFKKLC